MPLNLIQFQKILIDYITNRLSNQLLKNQHDFYKNNSHQKKIHFESICNKLQSFIEMKI